MSDASGESETESPLRRRGPSFKLDRALLSRTITLIIAVTALVLAGWALLRSDEGGDRDYSDVQRAEAKTKACASFDVVRRGIKVNTSIPVPDGVDRVLGSLAVGANARLAAYAGGLYLRDQLDPATPKDVADQVSEFADLLTGIGANATAGASNSDPDQTARLRAAEAASVRLGELCK